MKLLDLLEYVFSDFFNNKFKTGMSSLGIIIGVLAVVAMLTLGDALNLVLSTEFGNMDMDTIVVTTPATMGMTSSQLDMSGKSATLTDNDVNLLMNIPGVVKISPRIETVADATYRNENTTLSVIAVEPRDEDRLAGYIDKGRFLSSSSVNTVVLGSNIANGTIIHNLKPGSWITLTNTLTGKSSEYVIAGTLKQVNSSVYEGNPNSAIIMTKNGLKEIADLNTYSIIIVRVSDITNENEVASNIQATMSASHKNEAFIVISASELYQGIQFMYTIVKIVLGSFGAISLLVGGIGIMNVMMLTVRERVKEIGLMKAVGATANDVRSIFLMEAVLMGLLSSVAGVVISAVSSGLIGYFGHFPIGVSIQNALIGIAFGLSFTLIFGVLPASQASKMDPIEALRTE